MLGAIFCGSRAFSQTVTVNPGADLDAEAAALNPGDTLVLSAGTYSGGDFDISGKNGGASQWFTIKGADGETVVLDGGGAAVNIVNLYNSSYVKLQNLELKSGDDGVKINTNSHHISIENCYIHDVTGVGVNVQAYETSYMEVTDCEIAYCGSCGCYWGRSGGDGPVHHSRLAGSYVHHCGDSTTGYGIQIKMPGYANVIEDNVFHHVAGSSRAGIAVYFTGLDDSCDNVVRRNVIWNVPRYDNSSTTPGIWSCADAVVENNIVFDSGMGFHTNVYDGHAIEDLKVNNNTFFRCDSEGLYMATGSGCEAYNNACYRCEIHYPTGGGWATGGNLTSEDTTGVFQSTNFGDAGFLFPAGGGDLADNGDSAVFPADDFNGTVRPYNAVPDVGAYEYTGGGNPGWTIGNGFKSLVPESIPPAVAAGEVQISVTVSDPGGVAPHIWIDGVEYGYGGGTFTSPALVFTDGQEFTVEAEDTSGNRSAVTVRLDI